MIPTDRYASLPGVQLHYLDWGGSGEPLLFLPGLTEPASVFSWLAPRFMPRFRPIALTRRGHGKSEMPSGPYDIGQLVTDIATFLESLDIGNSPMVGHSFAGHEMTSFAGLFPKRVPRLVYLDAVFVNGLSESLLRENPFPARSPSPTPKPALASVSAYFAFVRETQPIWDRIWGPALEQAVLADLLVHEDGSVEEIDRGTILDEMVDSALREGYPFANLRCPALFLVAFESQHPNLPRDATDEMKRQGFQYQSRRTEVRRTTISALLRAKPDARVVELQEAPHHFFLTHSDEVFSHIWEFLTE